MEIYGSQLIIEIDIIFAAFVQIAGAEWPDIGKSGVENDGQVKVIWIVDESKRSRARQHYRVCVFENIVQMRGYEIIDKSYSIVHCI